jgi:hypothetical protein
LTSKIQLTEESAFKMALVIYGDHFELKPPVHAWFSNKGYEYKTARSYYTAENGYYESEYYLIADADVLVHFKLEWLT